MTPSAEPVRRGLAGVVADTTAVSEVDLESNALLYRGYPVGELCARRDFLDVAHLLWTGELPTAAQRAALDAAERARRDLDPALVDLLVGLPVDCHPMDVLRTAVSRLGATDTAGTADDPDGAETDADAERALRLLAALPAVVALDQRRRRGLAPIAPDPELDYAANVFHMTFGSVPDAATLRAFTISMILYAEHGFNASTFTARVVTSTRSDLHSAVVAGIGALKGPLHGGANEAVMRMFDEIGDGDPQRWLDAALAERRLVMGFGHRVYKHGDSRVPTLEAELVALAARHGRDDLMATYRTLAEGVLAAKGLHPNLDFPAGPLYHLMGFDIPTFTPLFVLARITGWTAHIAEQRAGGALIRPLAAYTGVARRPVPAM